MVGAEGPGLQRVFEMAPESRMRRGNFLDRATDPPGDGRTRAAGAAAEPPRSSAPSGRAGEHLGDLIEFLSCTLASSRVVQCVRVVDFALEVTDASGDLAPCSFVEHTVGAAAFFGAIRELETVD